MKLNSLKIKGFRGLDLEHSFENDQFIVLTGVNGSGKSTIIEAVDLLLGKKRGQVNQEFASQTTDEQSIFEIEIESNDAEIEKLGEKIYNNQPGNFDKEKLDHELKNNLFRDKKLKRKIVIKKPGLSWNNRSNNYIQEHINGEEVSERGIEDRISQSAFNVLSNEIYIKFEHLHNINLTYSTVKNRDFSISNIFPTNEDNPQQRLSRTNVQTQQLLDSLVVYEEVDETKIRELLSEFENVLTGVKFDIKVINNSSHIVLKQERDREHYQVHSASSGQKKAIVLLLIKFVWEQLDIKPIILLDEPENSLHPGLTSRLFNNLNELLSDDSQEPSLIIATHSPEVVSANTDNTYRIVTENDKSKLVKIAGLSERAAILNELGVYFHTDYVAQKIVFVESTPDKKNGELPDEEVYQRLIDPEKEEVLFISVGSRSETEKRHQFQLELFKRLRSASPGLISILKDRDDDEYDSSQHTPYRHIEYLYVCKPEVTAKALSKVSSTDISLEDVQSFYSRKDVQSLLDSEEYKNVWQKLIGKFAIRGKSRGFVQGIIASNYHHDETKRTEEINELISRFKG